VSDRSSPTVRIGKYGVSQARAAAKVLLLKEKLRSATGLQAIKLQEDIRLAEDQEELWKGKTKETYNHVLHNYFVELSANPAPSGANAEPVGAVAKSSASHGSTTVTSSADTVAVKRPASTSSAGSNSRSAPPRSVILRPQPAVAALPYDPNAIPYDPVRYPVREQQQKANLFARHTATTSRCQVFDPTPSGNQLPHCPWTVPIFYRLPRVSGYIRKDKEKRDYADPGFSWRDIIERAQLKRTAELEYWKELRKREQEREKAKADRAIAAVEKRHQEEATATALASCSANIQQDSAAPNTPSSSTSAPLNPPAQQSTTAPPTLPPLIGVKNKVQTRVDWIKKRPVTPAPPPPPEVQASSSASVEESVAAPAPLNQQEEEELLCSEEEEGGIKDINIQLEEEPMETNT